MSDGELCNNSQLLLIIVLLQSSPSQMFVGILTTLLINPTANHEEILLSRCKDLRKIYRYICMYVLTSH